MAKSPNFVARKSALAVMAACLILGAAPAWSAPSPLIADLPALLKSIPADKINNEPKTIAIKALDLIAKDKLDEGSKLINSALQLDPANSYLQFFNAFAYHLMAQRGDSSKLNLAEQGYQLAVQFDRSNWLAHYYQGLLHFEQRNFRAAQENLAEVLLFRPDDQEVLFRLVASSYYAGDPVTSAACLDRLRALAPSDPQILRLSAIISAAIGQGEDAKQWLLKYADSKPAERDLARVKERVEHWTMVHQTGIAENSARLIRKLGNGNTGVIMAPTQYGAPPAPQPGAFDPNAAAAAAAAAAGQPASPFGAPAAPGMPGAIPVPGAPGGSRMVLVDVVIMRTEDSLSSHKGLNLMSALTLQFGSSSAPSFSRAFSSSDTGTAVTATTTLTRAISVPALSYSLNIANSSSNLNEVLARPTLAALEGVKSEFFSGTTLNAAVVSTGANSGGGAVQIEKEIGVKLAITPTFITDSKIRLMVDAQRTFLKPPSAEVGFTYKIEVSKIMVNANVVMDFGETLVLGGLSEKETTHTRDGVPVLQDTPVLQYLFGNKDSNDFQRSVLMLITPRAPQYAFRSDEAIKADPSSGGDSESLKELRARYGDWFRPYPTMQSVFHHLNKSSIYREFRTGDVTLEKWDKQETAGERLRQALDFLFF